MPQDQDDIKGADAMKQAPTPGTLSADDVKLLVKGDWISHPEHGTTQYWPSASGDRCLTGPWSFVGRPDADGWIDHKAFDAPPPDDLMVEYITGSGLTSARMRVIELRWDRDFKWRPFRLAPTAPVEASGPENVRRRQITAVMTALDSFAVLAGRVTATQAEHVLASLDALRPQPSGETREAVERLKDDADYFDHPEEGAETHRRALCWVAKDIRTVLAALRPAPVASGGQHSSGEAAGCAESEVGRAVYERIEKLIDAKPGTPEGDELSFLAFLVESVEEVGGYDGLPASIPAPTTPARAEALDEGAAGEWRGDIRISRDLLCDVSHHLGDYISGLDDADPADAKAMESAQDTRHQVELRIDNPEFLIAMPDTLKIKEAFDDVLGSDLLMQARSAANRGLDALIAAHPSPTPAADADRVRIAVEALERIAHEARPVTRAVMREYAAKALAALKSEAT